MGGAGRRTELTAQTSEQQGRRMINFNEGSEIKLHMPQLHESCLFDHIHMLV